MTLINIKFSPEMEELILHGKKCCTTRDEEKGEIGDIFVVKNRVYRILQVDKRMHPYECSDFKLEGFESWKDLKCEIERIYPSIIKQIEFLSNIGTQGSEVYVHFFAYVGDWCPQFGVTGAACSNPEEFCELYSDCVKCGDNGTSL